MDLTKENIRKLRELILFTAVVIVCLWKYETTFEIISFVWNVIFPFILGGAIAFIPKLLRCISKLLHHRKSNQQRPRRV